MDHLSKQYTTTRPFYSINLSRFLMYVETSPWYVIMSKYKTKYTVMRIVRISYTFFKYGFFPNTGFVYACHRILLLWKWNNCTWCGLVHPGWNRHCAMKLLPNDNSIRLEAICHKANICSISRTSEFMEHRGWAFITHLTHHRLSLYSIVFQDVRLKLCCCFPSTSRVL